MQRNDQVSFVMMFCALMLVRGGKATLEQSMTVVPMYGNAKSLATQLCQAQ